MPRDAILPDGIACSGPYSPGVRAGGLVFLAGQTALDAAGRLVSGDVAEQTRLCLAHLGAVLAQAGLGFGDVVKCNVFLTDMADFSAMNAVYATAFEAPYPARTTVAVLALPLGARVEIEMVAQVPVRAVDQAHLVVDHGRDGPRG